MHLRAINRSLSGLAWEVTVAAKVSMNAGIADVSA
jgi:hypothetical protein